MLTGNVHSAISGSKTVLLQSAPEARLQLRATQMRFAGYILPPLPEYSVARKSSLSSPGLRWFSRKCSLKDSCFVGGLQRLQTDSFFPTTSLPSGQDQQQNMLVDQAASDEVRSEK